MRRIILTTTALALALSAGVQAQSGRYPDRYPDRDRDRYDDRYGYGRGDYRDVAELARDIDRTAESMYREAARNNRRPDRAEERMLYALRDLAVAADRFYADTGRRRDVRGSRQPYRVLLRSFDQAAAALSRVERRSYIDRGMDRIDDLLWQLSGTYRAGNGRYDRDGRGGRGWNRDRRWGGDRDGWRHGDRSTWDRRYDDRDDDDDDRR